MLPPLNTLDMIKFMHDEVHEKQTASQKRELAATYGEHRLGQLFRALFRRDVRSTTTRGEHEGCDAFQGVLNTREIAQ